ncbi:unnamed protein product, partial [Symbiodinium necroappetens]
ALLSQQSATLMEAQRTTLNKALTDLEARQDTKMEKLDTKQSQATEELAAQVRLLGDRLRKLEGQGGPGLGEGKKHTLVFGGWGRQTRRHVVLHQLSEVVEKLKLRPVLDELPFTTGPRRSIALPNFKPRQGEGPSEVRSRMMEVLTAVNGAQAQLVGAEKTLWCSFSRSPEERGKASLTGVVKKVVMTHRLGLKEELDLEYANGMSWLGEAQLSGLGEAPHRATVVTTKAGPGWVDVKGLAEKDNGNAKVRVLSWNVGGVVFGDLPKALGEASGQALRDEDLVILQEIPRREAGWQSQTFSHLKVSHREKGQWRGVGQVLDMLQSVEFLNALPATHLPTIIGADLNTPYGWVDGGPQGLQAASKSGKGNQFLIELASRGIELEEIKKLATECTKAREVFGRVEDGLRGKE